MGWAKQGEAQQEALIDHNTSNGLTIMHEIEGAIDVRQRHGVGDEIIDIDLAFHIPVDDARHLSATLRAAKSRAALISMY